MEQRLVKLLGTAAKHTLEALRRALVAVFVTGLLVFLITAVATELVGFLLTKQFNGTTHLVAAALALSFGYAVAVTVFLGEILRAIIKIIEMIVEESEKLAQAAIKEVGVLAREAGGEAAHLGRAALGDAGAVGHGLEHVVGGVAALSVAWPRAPRTRWGALSMVSPGICRATTMPPLYQHRRPIAKSVAGASAC